MFRQVFMWIRECFLPVWWMTCSQNLEGQAMSGGTTWIMCYLRFIRLLFIIAFITKIRIVTIGGRLLDKWQWNCSLFGLYFPQYCVLLPLTWQWEVLKYLSLVKICSHCLLNKTISYLGALLEMDFCKCHCYKLESMVESLSTWIILRTFSMSATRKKNTLNFHFFCTRYKIWLDNYC